MNLSALAVAAGIDPAYTSFRDEPVATSEESLVAALRALGPELGFELPSTDPQVVAIAVAAVERARWAECCPPVVVGWDGTLVVPFAVQADHDAAWEVEITTESGATHAAHGRVFELPADGHAWPGGVVHCIRHAPVAVGLEHGYHTLAWRCAGHSGTSLAIVAPTTAFGGPGHGARRWGVFAPVYGLATAASGETGDLATLRRLFEGVAARGGRYVATLPILAADLPPRGGNLAAFSPYSPVSRLFWNDLYMDLDALAHEAGLAAPVAPAPGGALIDYAAQYRWRHAAFAPMAAALLADPARAETFDRWAVHHDVYDYAAFRALTEQRGAAWRDWPTELRDHAPHVATRADAIALGADPAIVDRHVVAQATMQRQLEAIARGPVSLYLDLPVGVSCDAYEVWRWRDQFLTTLAAGAPPDALFLGGQNWGLPPLSPTAQRRDGYRYFRRCVRHHMRVAGMLRIDHVMGLFRLYCVPDGRPAKDGVYLRYRADELMAILTLESRRAGCAIVGEDLGTVPDHVRPAMALHAMFRLHVGQWALPARRGDHPAPSPAESVASLNTHDTATFAGWWSGADIDDRRALDLITDAQDTTERTERAAAREAVLAHAGDRHAGVPYADVERALIVSVEDLALGPAEVVLVALDDLALEVVPHNVPGTTTERPNWHHRVRAWEETLDPVRATPVANAALEAIAHARRP